MEMKARELVEQIRATRRALEITQTHLAQKAGSQQAAISAMERGKQFPSLKLALKILEVLEREKRKRGRIIKMLGQSQLTPFGKAS